MATKTIPQLPATAAALTTNKLEIDNAGTSEYVLVSQLITLFDPLYSTASFPAAASALTTTLLNTNNAGTREKLTIAQLITLLNTLYGSGTVTSVAFSTDVNWLTITGSPVTTTGTLTANLTAGLTQNQVLATPDGVAGKVGLRVLVATDIPNLDAAKITTGTFADARLSANVPLLNIANSFTAVITDLLTGLGTTVTDGLVVSNTTPAAAGSQQVSPSIHWTGQGWKTTAVAASQAVEFEAHILPVQGAAAPTGNWLLRSRINGGVYSTGLNVDTAGNVSAGNNLVANGVLSTDAGTVTTDGSGVLTTQGSIVQGSGTVSGTLGVTGISTFGGALATGTTVTDRLILTNTTASTVGVTQQFSPTLHWIGHAWKSNATAADQVVEYRSYVAALTGAAAATGEWRLEVQLNGGGFTQVAKIGSLGSITMLGGVVTGGSVVAGTLITATSGDITATNGNFISSAAGKGLNVKGGSNAKIGTGATLVAGTVTVSNTSVTANSRIFITKTASGGTLGAGGYTVTKSAGVSFTITSTDLAGATSILDTSVFDWFIVEQG